MPSFSSTFTAHDAPYASDRLAALLHIQSVHLSELRLGRWDNTKECVLVPYQTASWRQELDSSIAMDSLILGPADVAVKCLIKDENRLKSCARYVSRMTYNIIKTCKEELVERRKLMQQQQFCERMLIEGHGAFSPRDLVAPGTISFSAALRQTAYAVQPIQEFTDARMVNIIKWIQAMLQLEEDERFNSFYTSSATGASGNSTQCITFVVANATRDVFVFGEKVYSHYSNSTSITIRSIKWRDRYQDFRIIDPRQMVRLGITGVSSLFRSDRLPS